MRHMIPKKYEATRVLQRCASLLKEHKLSVRGMSRSTWQTSWQVATKGLPKYDRNPWDLNKNQIACTALGQGSLVHVLAWDRLALSQIRGFLKKCWCCSYYTSCTYVTCTQVRTSFRPFVQGPQDQTSASGATIKQQPATGATAHLVRVALVARRLHEAYASLGTVEGQRYGVSGSSNSGRERQDLFTSASYQLLCQQGCIVLLSSSVARQGGRFAQAALALHIFGYDWAAAREVRG